jgi:GT2 family glycosyltransferase
MIEYLNPKSHTIQLSSPDKKIIKVPGKSKIILSDWFMSYCPKYLRVVRVVGNQNQKLELKDVQQSIKYTPTDKRVKKLAPNEKRKKKEPKSVPHALRKSRRAKAQTPARIEPRNKRDELVGRRSKESSKKLYNEACQKNKYSVSNNIGIGILSFNRLNSLKRLISTIRTHTDLSRTTIFVSDESTDQAVPAWLKKQKDVVVLTNQKRLGIAGNTNRLLRCLSRFKYGILLNDDVEILKRGWETFYRDAHLGTNIHHFCYQQAGVYGAKKNNKSRPIGITKIKTIKDKPHGAVMFFTNELFKKIGYFDESFGMYGMEHVDWSTRASQCKLQPTGFHDVVGAEQYFKIHQEKSAVPQRTKALAQAREVYRKVNSSSRMYIDASKATEVPSISVVIPIRDLGRKQAVEVIVNSIRAQLFPNIEIIIAEQDEKPIVQGYKLGPRRYFFAKNKYQKQPFTKAMAFNLGIANATHGKVVLQDADIICPSGYLAKIHNLLDSHTGIHIGSQVLYLTQEATAQVNKTHKIKPNADCERVVTYYEGGSLACTREAYFKCGAFNEIFEGYGIEDCDFFDRLKYHSNFYNERSEDFIHMWHGRTAGWAQHHRRNKRIYTQLKKRYNMTSYISSLVKNMKATYPEITRELIK